MNLYRESDNELFDSDEAFLSIANELLDKCNIKERMVTSLDECSDEFFVAVYEGLLGDDLSDLIRHPISRAERVQNCQAVINVLEKDILGIDLSHITGSSVVDKDITSIQNLLEIFAGLLEYIMEGIDVGAPQERDLGDDDSNVLSSDHEVISDVLREEFGATEGIMHRDIIDPHREITLPSDSILSGAYADFSKVSDSTTELIRLGETGSHSSTPDNRVEIMRGEESAHPVQLSADHEQAVSRHELQTEQSSRITTSSDVIPTPSSTLPIEEPRTSQRSHRAHTQEPDITTRFMARSYQDSHHLGSVGQSSVLEPRVSSSQAAQVDSGPESDSTGELIRDSERVERLLARERLERDIEPPSIRHTVPPPVSRLIGASSLSQSASGLSACEVDGNQRPSQGSYFMTSAGQGLQTVIAASQSRTIPSPPQSPVSTSSSVSWPKEVSPLDPAKDGPSISGGGLSFEHLGVRPLRPADDATEGDGESSGRSTPVYHHHCHHHYHHHPKDDDEVSDQGNVPRPRSLPASILSDSVFALSSSKDQHRQIPISEHGQSSSSRQKAWPIEGVAGPSGVQNTRPATSGSKPTSLGASEKLSSSLKSKGYNQYTTDKTEFSSTVPSTKRKTASNVQGPNLRSHRGQSGVNKSLNITESDRSPYVEMPVKLKSKGISSPLSKPRKTVDAQIVAGISNSSTSAIGSSTRTSKQQTTKHGYKQKTKARKENIPNRDEPSCSQGRSSQTSSRERSVASSIDDSRLRELMKEYDKGKTRSKSDRSDILSGARQTMSERLHDKYRQQMDFDSDSDDNLSQCSDSVVDYQDEVTSPRKNRENAQRLNSSQQHNQDTSSSRYDYQDRSSLVHPGRAKRAVTFREDVDLFPVTSRMDRLRRELQDEERDKNKSTQRLKTTYNDQLRSSAKATSSVSRKRQDQNSPKKPTKRRKVKTSPVKYSISGRVTGSQRGRVNRIPLQENQKTGKQRKRSASASPTMSRRRKLPDDHRELLPLMLDEFPFLHVSPETAHKMWRKQMHVLNLSGKSAESAAKLRTQRLVDEAEKRQDLQARILRKEMDHDQRLREHKEREQHERAVKVKLQEKRIATARARRYYEDYQVRMKSRMLKRRTKEEQIFKKLFEDGLRIQKERIRELRNYAQEKRESHAKKQREEIQSLENYYGDQFAMLAETMADERKELELRDKAQDKVLLQMRRELRQKMEKEISDIQDHLSRDEDPAYIRQLEADRLRRQLQLATYKTYY